MKEMTSSQRFKRIYEHREADRIPVIDSPRQATIERWQKEGMPKDIDFVDFFGLDHIAVISVDNALLDMVWDAGYEFGCVSWPDDMGYKHNQFFSVKTYREILKPVHKRAIEWIHQTIQCLQVSVLRTSGVSRPWQKSWANINLPGLFI